MDIFVTFEQFKEAERNWDKLYNQNYKGTRKTNLWKFIGIRKIRRQEPNGYLVTENGYLVTEDAARKIDMLRSPYYRALMKAFIARTGYHKKF